MIKLTDREIWYHPTLVQNMKTILYNIKHDHSFLIIISGDKKVRVGKSMLAQQIAYFFSYYLKRPFTIDNIMFSGQALIEYSKTHQKGIYVLDETRASMSSVRVMTDTVQNIIDFFSETGMYNNIIILVLPDFFDLPKSVAIGLSECLINCFVSKKVVNDKELGEVLDYKRGYFGYWADSKKNELYIKASKYKNYNAVKWNFWGNFRKHWVIDEQEYNEKKLRFIRRSRQESPKRVKQIRDLLIRYIIKQKIMTQKELRKFLRDMGVDFSQQSISYISGKALPKTKNY